METRKFTRGQKFILIILAGTLIMVLALLGSFMVRSAPSSPISTLIVPSPTIGATASALSSGRPLQTPTEPSRPAASPVVDPEVLAVRRIMRLIEGVGPMRELPKQQEIPFTIVNEAEIATILRGTWTEAERRAFVSVQQDLLSAVDISPPRDEAYPPTIRTRARQVIAFYDPASAQIFVSNETGLDDPPDLNLVHQYAHALIDQHFELAELQAGGENADAARARDALVEGDAMAVLAMHSLGGVEQMDLEQWAEHLALTELTDYEGYITSRGMDRLVTFPYREGTRFVAALLEAGWWPAVNAAYLDPPASTEQILHPEKYIASPRDRPRTVDLPDLRFGMGEGWELVAEGVLGELGLREHLDQYLRDSTLAALAAAGWDGDLVAVWRGEPLEPDDEREDTGSGDQEEREVLLIQSIWDTLDDTEEFVQTYTTVIDNRLGGAHAVVRPSLTMGGRWWRGERGNAYLRKLGHEVLIIWAPDSTTMEEVLAVFALSEE